MRHVVNVVSCVAVLLSVALGLRDPYTRIEAESMDVNNVVSIVDNAAKSGSKYIEYIHKGDYIGFKQLNFSTETVAIEWHRYNHVPAKPFTQMLLRLGTPTSTPVLTHSIDTPVGWLSATVLIPICELPRGVHDLYFTFEHPTSASHLVAIDWIRFVTLDSLLAPSCKTGMAIDRPTPQPCTCPESPPCNVQPTTDLQPQVSIDKCDNSTQSHKQIVINIY